MFNKVWLAPGGKLFVNVWKNQKEIEIDITDTSYSYLWWEADVKEGTTLKDILLLIKGNLDIYEKLLGRHCVDIIEEGLKDKPQDSKISLDYVQLARRIEVSDSFSEGDTRKGIYGILHPELYGVGPYEDNPEETFALELSPVNEFSNLPFKIIRSVSVLDYSSKEFLKEKYGWSEISLGDVLHGIIYNLSFFGNPTERNDALEEISKRVSEAKSVDWIEVNSADDLMKKKD